MIRGLKRRLQDYPTDQWIEASGECGVDDEETGVDCKSPVDVRILKPVEDDTATMELRCRDYKHEMVGVVGWTVGDKPVTLGDADLMEFFPILKRADYGYCGLCGRIVVDVPLIVWGPDEKKVEYEVDICDSCVNKNDLLTKLAQGPEPPAQDRTVPPGPPSGVQPAVRPAR